VGSKSRAGFPFGWPPDKKYAPTRRHEAVASAKTHSVGYFPESTLQLGFLGIQAVLSKQKPLCNFASVISHFAFIIENSQTTLIETFK
jgi:hypothetical protein